MPLPSLIRGGAGTGGATTSIPPKSLSTAWVTFDGNTTEPTILDSYNVDRVERVGGGFYRIFFETPMDNSNYSYTTGVANDDDPVQSSIAFGTPQDSFPGDTSTESLLIKTAYIDGNGWTFSDNNRVNVHIFGGLTDYASLPGAQVIQASNTTNYRIALIGDSITDQNDSDNGTTIQYSSRGWIHWANALLGNRLDYQLSDNLGEGGNTTDDMLSDVPNAIANPGEIVVVLGGTNDIRDEVSTTSIISNLESIYTQILNSGKRVVAMTILPRVDVDPLVGVNEDRAFLKIHEVNNWIRKFCRQNDGMILCDPYSRLVDTLDTRGQARSEFFADTVHLNANGAFVVGSDLANAISQYTAEKSFVPANSGDSWDASFNQNGNMLTNGWLAGTSGSKVNATGSVADGWTVNYADGNANVSVVCAKENLEDELGFAQTVEVSVNSDSTGADNTVILEQAITGASLTTGDEVFAEINTSIASVTRLKKFGVELASFDGDSELRVASVFSEEYDYSDKDFNAVIRTPYIDIQDFVGPASEELRLRIIVKVDNNAGDGVTLKVNSASVRKDIL